MKRGVALALCLLGTATVARAAGFDLTAAERTAILKAHNDERALAKTPPVAKPLVALKWSAALADTARKWAAGCQYQHNAGRNKTKGFTYVGENLFATTASYGVKLLSDAVAAWSSEKKDFTYGPLSPSNYMFAAHYTQVIWSDTTEVGCAYAKCAPPAPSFLKTYVVCNYGPAGNWMGMAPYKKK